MTAKETVGRDRPLERMLLPWVGRLSEGVTRFLLAAALSGAEVMGGHALFGLALVGVCRPGGQGLAALLGAALGYLSFWGFVGGLRYIAAAMMTYAVALALGEFQIYHCRWFMPLATAALNGLVGFVYQSAAGWTQAGAVGWALEVVLTGAAVYFFRLAFDLWEQAGPGGHLTLRQITGVVVLGAALMMTLARVTVADNYALGRVLCVAAVLLAGWKGGVGVGATVGVSAGVAMDLAAGTPGVYTVTYALPGLISGLFVGQGRMMAALSYLLTGSCVVLWSWAMEAGGSHGYEMAAGVALFLLIPDRLLRRMAALTRREGPAAHGAQMRQRTAQRLHRAATAFRSVSGGLRGSFQLELPHNDQDAARVFDRAADQVCVRCRQRERCWQEEYQSTRTALTDALPPILQRGEGVREDFPQWFVQQCPQFDKFLGCVNGEILSLRQRRRYDSQVRESRAAVCAQYGQLAQVLDQAAQEVSWEPEIDLRRQRLVKQYLGVLGLEGRCTVYCDPLEHLHLEVEGVGMERLGQPAELERLGSLMGCALRAECAGEGRVHLVQREPLVAVVGAAAQDREGRGVSGDLGAWFRDESGQLNVLLCDGMGSGAEAQADSNWAMGLLEKFLRAGLPPEGAFKTVGEALALRGEEEGGFTTLDLLRVDLYTGRSGVYKLGAAPTYVRRSGRVERLCGATLPAGLGSGAPDVFHRALIAGDCVVMVSDGITEGGGDGWLCQALEGFDGASPRALAQEILSKSGARLGQGDDRTVLVLKLAARKE